LSPAIRGGAGVVREGREGFVDITGVGGMLGEMGFGGGGLREADFGGGEAGGIGMLGLDVSNEAAFAGDLFLVRIFANFSANSFVTPS
jgi:hypothetical protein